MVAQHGSRIPGLFAVDIKKIRIVAITGLFCYDGHTGFIHTPFAVNNSEAYLVSSRIIVCMRRVLQGGVIAVTKIPAPAFYGNATGFDRDIFKIVSQAALQAGME